MLLEEKVLSTLASVAIEVAQIGATTAVAVVGGTIVVSSVAASTGASSGAAAGT